MTEECKLLSIPRYRTPDGEPTCIKSFKEKTMCPFFMTSQMGIQETCFWMKDKELLDRRTWLLGERTGYLIPFNGCPVWKE